MLISKSKKYVALTLLRSGARPRAVSINVSRTVTLSRHPGTRGWDGGRGTRDVGTIFIGTPNFLGEKIERVKIRKEKWQLLFLSKRQKQMDAFELPVDSLAVQSGAEVQANLFYHR